MPKSFLAELLLEMLILGEKLGVYDKERFWNYLKIKEVKSGFLFVEKPFDQD
jgi:hypothetical protein